MSLNYDQQLFKDFNELLESDQTRNKESLIQDFLEKKPELLPTPNLINHHLHFNFIISKFPLDTSLITDYVYMTKSSGRWRVHLVELEIPDKEIFNTDKKQTSLTSTFSKAVNQVREWQLFVNDKKDQVMNKLTPIWQPINMRNNPVEFHYHLIIGRTLKKNNTPAKNKYLNKIRDESNINIMTYDTLLSFYKHGPRFKKNIVRLTKTLFEFKCFHKNPDSLFAYVKPDEFKLNTQE